MNAAPLTLSVVIPVYNEKDTIRTIIDLVLAQPDVDEVVLVDDFSTDGTRDVLRGFYPGEAAPDVLLPQLAVEADRGIDLTHDGGGAFGVAAPPHLVAGTVVIGDGHWKMHPSLVLQALRRRTPARGARH